MLLKSQMAVLRRKVEGDLPYGTFGRLQAEATGLRGSGVLHNALKAGDSAPDFRLLDSDGVAVQFSDLLEKGPVVICFYRGDWCPFCNLQLRALAEISDEIRALGASLVAVAPQTADARRLTGTQALPFPLLVDVGAKISKNFGLAFMPAQDLHDVYAALGRPADAECETALLVPASYIVDPLGTIVFSYLDSNFTNRLEPTEILTALKHMHAMPDA